MHRQQSGKVQSEYLFSFQEQPRDQFSEQLYSISQIVPDREYATVSPYIKKDFQ